VSSLLLLMGLLLVAYLGSFLVGGERSVRGVGLPSSVEWIVVGFIIGPGALGVVSRSLTVAVEPVVVVALSWLLLVCGAQYPITDRGRVSWPRVVIGVLWGVVSAGTIGCAVYVALPYIAPALLGQRLVLSLALAAASGETTQHVMRWVRERYGASGPLLDWLEDLTVAEDVVPVGIIVALSAMAGHSKIAAWVGPWAIAGLTVGLGALLGALCALLLGREFRLRESWGTLLGLSLVGVGVAAQVGLSYLAVLFVLGATLIATSRHAGEVRAMLAPTERGALLPILIICGISLDTELSNLKQAALVFGVVFGARLLVRLVLGRLLAASLPFAAAGGAGRVGMGLLSSGSLTMCIGLATALAFPGSTGTTVLLVSAALCVAGELAGPPMLRGALRRAGEIRKQEASGAPPAPPTIEETA
jgi:hypothetical protein